MDALMPYCPPPAAHPLLFGPSKNPISLCVALWPCCSYLYVYTLVLPNSMFIYWGWPAQAAEYSNVYAYMPVSVARDISIVLMVLHQVIVFGLVSRAARGESMTLAAAGTGKHDTCGGRKDALGSPPTRQPSPCSLPCFPPRPSVVRLPFVLHAGKVSQGAHRRLLEARRRPCPCR